MKKNLNKIDWFVLSANPSSMSILLKNKNKIVWSQLSANTHNEALKLLKRNLKSN